ncbi:MAG: HAMP domain-containing histidine kinase [Paenibacillaceae bacterium]|nr:HAMP domain-containing histidine kinase [Paenibacillaceae bacterium]
MRERLADNPEVRRLAAGMAAVLLLFLLVSLVAGYFLTSALHAAQQDRSLAIIGRLAAQHPEWRDDVTKAFAAPLADADIAAGKAAAVRYGFDKRLPLAMNRDFGRFAMAGAVAATAGTLVLAIALMLLLWRVFRRLYGEIGAYAVMAERIVEGDFSVKAVRPAEGIFAKLAHQFNQMSARLELTLERLQEEKEGMKTFLSDISHQLKTPLAGIKMMTELLQDGAAQDEKVRADFLARSAAQIERMEWLIRQLLLVARMEAGAIELNRKEQPLRLTVERAVETMADQAAAGGLKLTFRTERAAASPFMHDADWLQEAIANLLKNSIEHTPAGGDVQVELGETPVLARVRIRDNGEGIAEEDLPHIFKRFYKGRASSPSVGTGIGLSLAKAIVERHGGFIAVQSTPGQGTVMTLTFAKFV